ncbi:unnamed protein product [Rotaria sp. Silwood1]|nr:unnamed protein product [Rotaria sp. Silwood1]
MSEIIKKNLTDNFDLLINIIKSLNKIKEDQYSDNSLLTSHSFFATIRERIIFLLHCWRNDQALTDSARNFLTEVTSFLPNIEEVLLQKQLLDELNACIEKIVTSDKHRQDQLIYTIGRILEKFQRLMQGDIDIQENSLLTPLLNVVFMCLRTPFYAEMLQHVGEEAKLNNTQFFFFVICPHFMNTYEGSVHQSLVINLARELVSVYTLWLAIWLNKLSSINNPVLLVINRLRRLTTPRANLSWRDILVKSDIFEAYLKLIDYHRLLLQHLSTPKTNDTLSLGLIAGLLQSLFMSTINEKMFSHIQSEHLVPLLFQFTDIDDDLIQFNAYRFLAKIITEDDVKALANPVKIASVFVKRIDNDIDNQIQQKRLNNTLLSLQSLVQHDQIKDELVKQNLLPLLIRCATEDSFHPIRARQRALELLLSFTFNDDAAHFLKQNVAFIDHLRTLQNAPEEGVQRAAEGILWKLEKEAESIAKLDLPIIDSHQYDIMLSYSHSDKQLCHRIHDSLVKDQFRVWLDRDHMHGATMTAMANAIENSEIVLISMSDAYKQSAYCQAEAHYAFEKQRRLIPLIVESGYKPDGWLGIIASGKVYVDVPKLGFQLAYVKLKNEINQYRVSAKQFPSDKVTKTLQHNLPITMIPTPLPPPKVDQQVTVTDYPHCIDWWTEEHVRSFLIEKKLTSLLPMLADMNGSVLHEYYSMCRANRDSIVLRLSSPALNNSSSDEIMSILANNTNKVELVHNFLNYAWVCC